MLINTGTCEEFALYVPCRYFMCFIYTYICICMNVYGIKILKQKVIWHICNFKIWFSAIRYWCSTSVKS